LSASYETYGQNVLVKCRVLILKMLVYIKSNMF